MCGCIQGHNHYQHHHLHTSVDHSVSYLGASSTHTGSHQVAGEFSTCTKHTSASPVQHRHTHSTATQQRRNKHMQHVLLLRAHQ